MKNAVIQLKNFGPIKNGQFELNPLTIFMGQNNTGKTYCALLVYSIHQAISGAIPGTMPSNPYLFLSGKYDRNISKDFRNIKETFKVRRNVSLSDFPEFTRKQLAERLNESFSLLPRSIEIALHKYFQYDQPNELICKNLANPRSMVIDLKDVGGNSYLNLKVAPRSTKVRVSTPLSTEQFTLNYSQIQSILERKAPTDVIMYNLLLTCFRQLFAGFNRGRVYYLPAARSGTLQVWPLLGTAITENLSRTVGLYPISLGTVPGITSDFMTTIYNLFGRSPISRKSKLDKVIDFMETEILEGQIGVSKTGDLKTPTFLYSTPGIKIDLSRSSSMVAELAPLDILMKRLLLPGDLLIIDEPEAHLHPEKQRKAALLLAKLVRHGVKVICTTHSHIFLHQISNLVLASNLKSDKKERLNLVDSCLEQSDVGVYLFQKKDSLVNINKIPMTGAVGYTEDEYVSVYEELLEEYHDVSSH